MNKYEERARQQRRATMRSSATLWSAAATLIAVVVVILGFSASAPREFWYRAGIGLAIMLLVVRILSRRLRNRAPRAARPDPKSALHLD